MTSRKDVTLVAGLDVALHAHELSELDRVLSCWTVVTNGLAVYGQRELALTVLRAGEAKDGLPPGVLGYVRSVKQLAEQRRLVDSGGLSGWQAPGPLGLGDFVGVAFFDAVRLRGIELPSDALAGVFLKQGEVEMAMGCSVARVLNAIGRQTRYFPTPYWSDPLRSPVYASGDSRHSCLSQLPRAIMSEATAAVALDGDRCLLTLPTDNARALADCIESQGAAAVITGRDPESRSAVVWRPNQAQPEATFAAGSSPGEADAVFVALVGSDARIDNVTFLEDGYAAVVSPETKRRLIASLRTGTSVEVRGGTPTRTLTVHISTSPSQRHKHRPEQVPPDSAGRL